MCVCVLVIRHSQDQCHVDGFDWSVLSLQIIFVFQSPLVPGKSGMLLLPSWNFVSDTFFCLFQSRHLLFIFHGYKNTCYIHLHVCLIICQSSTFESFVQLNFRCCGEGGHFCVLYLLEWRLLASSKRICFYSVIEIGDHLVTHGDGVKDIAFAVEDCRALFQVLNKISIVLYNKGHSFQMQGFLTLYLFHIALIKNSIIFS